KLSAGADLVYLATDPDREGEAISWHLKELLNLSDEKAKRVTFNEITKKVVQESIQEPREIDQKLVDAQQARRVLDRIVGYQISPVMWKKIKPKLSAGRVQSVATRMVNEREKEIEGFTAEEYWTLDAELLQDGKTPFTAHYHGVNGKKQELCSEAEVAAVTEEIRNEVFCVKSVKRSDKQRSPSPPFTTSSMQQEASRKLNMTPRRTMAIAQQLYEGVDIAGEGTVGLITYMRTDSLRISEEAIAAAKSFILGRYGADYYPAQPRRYKAKGNNAQDAHEAIRPSNVELTPEQIKSDLTPEQYRLYRLVWSRFVASQMENAVYDSVNVEVTAAGHDFRASASHLKFSGYTAVYEEGRDEDSKEEKESALPSLAEGEVVELKGFRQEQHFTQPPSRYTDATLIRAMEEQGIGRPSTYAPTVSTILDRSYVKKSGKYLHITNLGRAVTEWMEKYFADIEDLKFTANMEQRLDAVEDGSVHWRDILRDFYGDFEDNIKNAAEGDRQAVPPEYSDELCPVCGKQLVERDGRFGRFLGCSGYPECTFTMPLVEVMPGSCPKCGGRMQKRTGTSRATGKQFTYYSCEFTKLNDPEASCDFMSWDVPVKDDCPSCGKTMFKRSGRGFKRPYCVNEACERFLPEDKRGYPKKKSEDGEEKGAAKAAEKKSSRKTAEKKTAEKKTTGKTAEKKSTAKKAAAKTSAKKPAAKKDQKGSRITQFGRY
ncbi:MAG: type I DNA topoisomerase, partial [Oscillospiraceae bacterium]|nr:type I DNA topoisomerase [Oscillospiraceae bacterium]